MADAIPSVDAAPNVDAVQSASPRADKAPSSAGSSFSWHNIEYIVGANKTEKTILSNISGKVESGEVCALIGPSGAGKTSLLNILAGRVQSRGDKQRVCGSTWLNGSPLTGSMLRKRIAYVMQQDVIHPTQTPREALLFSANMRMPSRVSPKEKKELVEMMLRDLGLAKCADTYIGNELTRGISGGEKKRTSIGIELIMRPRLVFLDEPTSGLDSYAAHSVVAKLRELAGGASGSSTLLQRPGDSGKAASAGDARGRREGSGCSVLCTIHQPSSEVFHSFSKVMVLREGQLFFFGTVSDLSSQLDRLGHGCPRTYNLADHVMFLMEAQEQRVVADLQTQLQREAVADVQQESLVDGKKHQQEPELEPTAGFFTQLAALTRREALGVWRNKPGLIASVMMPLVLHLLFALIFFQVGDVDADNYDSQSHFGAVTQVAIGGMFGASQPLILRFPLDRGIFLREYSTRTYGAVAYFLSKSAVELPQSLVNSAIVWTTCYWLMSLHGSFIVYVLTFWITGMAAGSLALLLGSVAANPEVASQSAAAIFTPQLLFAGFFIKLDNVPVFLRWAQYLCALKYGMNLYILNEFGEETREDWPESARNIAKTYVTLNDIEPDHWPLYVGLLIAMILVVRMLSLLVLARRAKSFF